MNTILSKPYRPIWLAIPIIMGLAIVGINSAIGLQLHGTYLVITPIHLGVWLSIILGALGFLYWLVRKRKLVHWMTAIHVAITVLSFTLIMAMGLASSKGSGFGATGTFNQVVLFVVAAQLLFLGNLVVSSVKGRGAE
jgi:peptidoglycan/LPS O-acetylase OafA/YrhL